MAPHKTLKQKAEEKLASRNATQLGDPISLKAETSDNIPTPEEAGAKGSHEDPNQPLSDAKPESKPPPKDSKHKTLKEIAQETNPTMLGDPISLKAETSDTEPTENDRGALHDKKIRSRI